MSIAKTPYTHLLPEDIPVWERFLASHGKLFYQIKYDVRVGNGRPIGRAHPKNMQKMAIMLSQRRIDAVGFSSAGIVVIEITRYAGFKAIGQLKSYPTLYKQRFDPRAKVEPLLVAEFLESDIEQILMIENIDYILI